MPPAKLPYDITDIPFFAWMPGGVAWALALMACLALLLLERYLTQIRRAKADGANPFTLAKLRLTELLAAPAANARESLSSASLLLRRILAVSSIKNASSLSLHELSQAANESNSQAVGKIVKILALMESSLYGKEDNTLALEDSLQQALTALEELESERKLAQAQKEAKAK